MENRNATALAMRRVAGEAVAIMVAGILFGLGANFLSPRGLALGHNPFPGVHGIAPLPPPTNAGPVAVNSATNLATNATLAMVVARLKDNGLQVADSNRVAQLFRDPRYNQELVIFVDARDDRLYQEGHVPGAYQFDHYRVADYLAGVMMASRTADVIVVYCNGGNCEDSLFTAVMLRDFGVPAAKLLVYAGGMTEWVTNGLPVELGVRKSGQLKGGAQ
jgi:rhodanese-related sulfurtransferase